MRATSHQHMSTHSKIQLSNQRAWPMKSSNTVRELFSPIFTIWIKCRIQFLFTFKVFPAAVTVHGFALVIKGHLGTILAQFKQFKLNFSGTTGVNTRGTGEGMPFRQGEIGEGEFPRKGVLLSTSFSGDFTSLSPTWMSFLILCAKGGRFEGKGAFGESGKGRFLALGVLKDKAEPPCRCWTQARAAWRREPFLGGGREGAARAALWSTERQ